MDEIQACMISLSDMEKKSSAATSSSTKNDISNRYTKMFIKYNKSSMYQKSGILPKEIF